MQYPTSLWHDIKDRKLFEGVDTYFMFIGYPKSGHTLIGSLLDAHPNIIVGHELNTLKYILAGFRKGQIYSLLLKSSQTFTERGRYWSGYSYEVPHQWQGRFKKLQIIGDKKGVGSTLVLRSYPRLLQRLRHRIDGRIKFVHVVRNPYDNISSITKKRKPRLSLEESIDYYFSLCETVAESRKQIRSSDWFDLRHESFVEDPKNFLKEICFFLGADAPDDYLDDCAKIVFKSPHKTRYNTQWNSAFIDTVKERMAKFTFLGGYSFKD